MKRALVIIAACMMLLGPIAQGQASAQTEPGVVAGKIDYYWATTFAENGRTYWGPTIVGVFGESLTACGYVDPFNFGPAAYCPADYKIYLSGAVFGADESFWYVALAHEWGHHIESLLGYSPEPSMESELRTDCMAGAFLGEAVAEGYAPRATYNGAFYIMLLIGDPEYLPEEMESHGTASQRAKAFNTGYSEGIAGCNVGLS
jgi:predicted metalloprotease